MIEWINIQGYWWIPKLLSGIFTWTVLISVGFMMLVWLSRIMRFIYYKARNFVRKARKK